MSPTDQVAHDQAVLALGNDLFQRMKGETPGVFNKDFWQGKILDWAMKDPSFKVDMFRFVDVLPVLEGKEQVSQHIKEYLLRDGRELPTVINAALKAATGGLTAGLASAAIKKNVTDMAERFIVGQDAKSALSELKKLHKQGIAFTVDLLGEATLSENESDEYARRYMDLIDNLADEVASWPTDEVIDRNHLGPIPRTNVSLKISAMFSQIDPVDPVGSVARLRARVLPLFLHAKKKNVFLNMDLEQWAFHDITYDLFEEILSHDELRAWPHVGIVVQAYLKSAERDVERLIALAKKRGAPVTVRLVKGAYWDYETVIAQQNGHEPPVFQDKAETDLNYEKLSRILLANLAHIYPAFGSHNLRSLTNALVVAKQSGAPERAYEVQMLYGMAEPERKVLRGLGHRVRVYAPVGELLPGMAYLVRRLLENTSNDGFLKLSHHDNVDTGLLLKTPVPSSAGEPARKTPMVRGDLSTPFEGCAPTDFTDRARWRAFNTVREKVNASFPRKVPVVVEGAVRSEGKSIARVCPSTTTLTVANVTLASVDDATRALDACARAYPEWRDRPLVERAKLLEKLADVLERDRDELSLLIAFEVGKPWKGADADVCEAVDFCRYYARQAQSELAPRTQGHVLGEHNLMTFEGRGPTVVIAPWNFPLAILCGMATAALVAGNPVVMKPAEQSSAVGHALFTRMLEAGFPTSVVHFLPGIGEDVGPVLTSSPHTANIVFTGSKSVGLSILESAAKVRPGQRELTRVVCEMGGKNAIIVDDDADIDEAIKGCVESAFGFGGQKCSAASRVLVLEGVWEAFSRRLVEAARSLEQGPAHDPAYAFGPVVDEEAHARLMRVIENPGEGVRVLMRGKPVTGGHYVPATIVEVSDPNHALMQNELFGPVLACHVVKSFDDALTIATASDYALTGAVFSRSPMHLDEARRRFRVGNLYLNRGSTGALVERQPFGGFQMSGLGTKAGGPTYLLQFVNPRVVTENTLRRGFTPDLET
jgi:RHH-type proline utilization regulon transcriptional repressor/proline dehydrogenase/delta 1-pyrroline-5-carboxylate dehydrogenase